MDMEPWMIEIARKLEVEYKDKLGTTYGVEIHTDAILLACKITKRYSDVLLSNEGVRDHLEAVLEKKAVEMVEEACRKLRCDLDTNVEEKALDFDEYSLCRTLVEWVEVKREKDPAKKFWFPHVLKDYKDLMDKWDSFFRKWKPTVLSRKRSDERYILEKARQMLVSCLQGTEGVKDTDSTPLSGVVGYLRTLVAKLMLSIHENFKQNLTVTPCLIAEVASPLTGIPASWLLHFPEPPLQGLEPRLAKGLIGQEHVPFVISNALSRHRGYSRPIGSFLFLNSRGLGWTEISSALAKQLFDDKERFIEINLSKYSDSDSVTPLFGFPSSSSCHEGSEAVKWRPYTVVLFNNVDKAHHSVIDVLIEIVSHGRASNGQGSTTDFTKTLIIMTSNIMDFKVKLWRCNCVQTVQEFSLKDLLSPGPSQKGHRCIYIDLLREAKKHFRDELFEKLDDVIFFKQLISEQYMAALRLQVRDIAMRTMTEKKLVLYPSDAALRHMFRQSNWCHVWQTKLVIRKAEVDVMTPMGGYAMRLWLEEILSPLLDDTLANNEIDDMSTIYIDALVGKQELSCRLEFPAENLFMMHCMESLRELRSLYLKEKERVNKVYLLRRNLFELMKLLDAGASADLDSVAEVAQALVKTLYDIRKKEIEVKIMLNECKMVHVNSLKRELELKQKEKHGQRSKSGVQGLLMRVSRLLGENQAVDVVVETLLNSVDLSRRPAMSFLFLGLTRAGEADLVDCLSKHLIADDGMNLLIRIDLSEYTESDSLHRFLDGPLELPYGQEQSGLSLLQAVRMRPHSVLLFSQVEKAHMSIFSALLLILDHGIFNSHGGHTVEFRNTVVIFTSDLGNKAILSRLVGDPDQGSVWDGATEQEKRGFRFELLNRMDEIVFFNPFAREQLRKVARVSMRALPRPEESPLAFSNSFWHLFNRADDPFYEKWPAYMDLTVSLFSSCLLSMNEGVEESNC